MLSSDYCCLTISLPGAALTNTANSDTVIISIIRWPSLFKPLLMWKVLYKAVERERGGGEVTTRLTLSVQGVVKQNTTIDWHAINQLFMEIIFELLRKILEKECWIVQIWNSLEIFANFLSSVFAVTLVKLVKQSVKRQQHSFRPALSAVTPHNPATTHLHPTHHPPPLHPPKQLIRHAGNHRITAALSLKSLNSLIDHVWSLRSSTLSCLNNCYKYTRHKLGAENTKLIKFMFKCSSAHLILAPSHS